MGISGRVIPGCAETFMDSQPMQGQQQGQGQQGQQGQEGQQGQQGQQQQQGQQGFRDMHQKVEHVRHGDVIAITPGSAHWIYNTGDQPLVIISLLDIANYQNQLDRNPRVHIYSQSFTIVISTISFYLIYVHTFFALVILCHRYSVWPEAIHKAVLVVPSNNNRNRTC